MSTPNNEIRTEEQYDKLVKYTFIELLKQQIIGCDAPNESPTFREQRTPEESDLYLNIVTFGQPFIEEDGSRVGYIYNGKKYYSPDLI